MFILVILLILGSSVVHTPSETLVEGELVSYKCEAPFCGPKKEYIAVSKLPELRMTLGNMELEEHNSSITQFIIAKVFSIRFYNCISKLYIFTYIESFTHLLNTFK